MIELSKSRACDHGADAGEAAVRPNAADGEIRNSKPNAAAASLDAGSEGAIIDQGIANGSDATDAFEHFAADENAATGSRRASLPRSDPARRIQHEEEEHKRRDEKLLAERFAAQLHHDADEVETALGLGEERGQKIRRKVFDIGVGEQIVFGSGMIGLNTGGYGPELSLPAGRAGGDANGEVGVRCFGGAVGALVIGHDNAERMALGFERSDGASDEIALIARGNDGGDGVGLGWRTGAKAFAQLPESATK